MSGQNLINKKPVIDGQANDETSLEMESISLEMLSMLMVYQLIYSV
jgi:hypothetical protein